MAEPLGEPTARRRRATVARAVFSLSTLSYESGDCPRCPWARANDLSRPGFRDCDDAEELGISIAGIVKST